MAAMRVRCNDLGRRNFLVSGQVQRTNRSPDQCAVKRDRERDLGHARPRGAGAY
jgi:hypothetical protein